ncbi:hypothetical protein PJ985_22340 [Streptomyces sp. ACA25]|uniref:hypothetical protein n=1 Tax=Streptomyces sp. ACA25 TaxID=3022596 RepID=UPI002307150A|nr:hypothetical protein [Streptomyces sp. ACA25]MDB1090296.1 hypothetical protein [Streptomyces sp. ACA25]
MVLESGAAAVAAGWMFTWAVRKARVAAGAADRAVDRVLEQALERLEALVCQRLSGESAAARLEEEARTAAVGGDPVDVEEPVGGGEGSGLSDRTRQRVALALEDAAEDDAQFGAALVECLRQIDAARAQSGAAGVVGHGSGNTAGRDYYNVVGERPQAMVRTGYLDQISHLVPEELVDREEELAELTAFTRPDTTDTPRSADSVLGSGAAGCYRWWRADAWAGKSALMAWFATHPPQGVDLVPFFITARHAGQNTRQTFQEALIPQLADIAGTDYDLNTGENGQRRQLFSLYRDAAEASARRHRRLVLLVDGIDEDAGITGNGHSIAALLPPRPPAGMRVITAGRLNPPVPGDVPAGHPLRSDAITRTLANSPHAEVLRDEAMRSLHGLLNDTGLGRDVLGLITGSGGGLTIPDLAHLTGTAPFQVEGIVHSTTGRVFTPVRDTDTGPAGYIFGHDTLNDTALEAFGTTLAAYRDRIHAWAGDWSGSGWPAETPGYLLHRYNQLLHTLHNTDRLTHLATDRRRQDRLREATGGDTTALADIRHAQTLHDTTPAHTGRTTRLDLTALSVLSYHLDRIRQRHSYTPDGVPALWYQLGHRTRAINLAHSLADPYEQADALTDIAQAAAQAGEVCRARELLTEAQHLTTTITDPYQHAEALASIAQATAQAGFLTDAQHTAATITEPELQVEALAVIAQTAAQAGQTDRARQLLTQAQHLTTTTITEPHDHAYALAGIARATTQIGSHTDAQHIAATITDPLWHASALAGIAQAAAQAGQTDRARQLLTQAQHLTTTSINDPYERVQALVAIAQAAAHAGETDRAKQLLTQAQHITTTITYPYEHTYALADIARAAAEAGETGRAQRLLSQAQHTTRTITNPDHRADALADIAQATAQAGFLTDAERIATTLSHPHQQAYALAGIARTAAEAGGTDRARGLLTQAQHIATSITDPDQLIPADSAIAAAHLASSNEVRAAVVAVTVLRRGGWEHVLGVLQALSPEAVGPVEAELRQDLPHGPGS